MGIAARDGQGTEMVSMAILMAAGSEKASGLPGVADLAHDQGESEGISFAKSFNERIGTTAALLQAKSTADKAAIVQPDLKSTPAKQLSEAADLPNAGKSKGTSAKETSAHIELKNIFADKIGQPPATAISVIQEKRPAGGPGVKEVDAPTPLEESTDDVSSGIPITFVAPASGATADGFMSQVKNANEDRPVVSSGDLVVVPKEIETGTTTKESPSAKKVTRTQESVAVAKAVSKAEVEIKPPEGAVPVTVQVTVPSVAVQSEIGKVAMGFGKAAAGVAKISSEVSPTLANNPIRQESVPGKANVVDTANPGNTAPDPGASSEMSVAPEKMAEVIPPTSGGDGENKSQSTPEPIAAVLHSMTGGSVVSDSAPIAVFAAGNTETLDTTTLPVVHPTSLPVGPTEQDVYGLVASTIDGAPRLLTTTPTALEVGIQSGTHGWLKVRVEMTDIGVVNASVSSSSSAGQEMLHRELPALTAYLEGEKVAVNAIVVHTPLATGEESRSSDAGMDTNGGETPQRNDERGNQQRYPSATNSDGIDGATTYQSSHGVDEDGSLPLATYAIGGGWLSVRA